MKAEGVFAIVVRVFQDRSAWVRISEGAEEGEDVALTADQVGQVEPGEAGWVVGRRGGPRFVRRAPGLKR